MYDSVEHIEDFTVDGNGYAQDEPEHDAAGNLTYDGQYAYTYDAWNRMVASHRAFRTPSGTGTLTLGSTVLSVRYDGLGRRIERTITHSGDFDATYHDYHDPGGHSVIEIRNGSNLVLKQHVWAAPAHGYIDELVQVALNADPFTDEDFTDTGPGSAGGRFYFALQDANYNVLALVDADGSLAERYEYTPYGQRQVYYSPGTNDPKLHAPYLTSRRWKVGAGGAADQPYGLNDLGHQGLSHDEVTGLVHNRARMLHPRLGRFMQRDPLGQNQAGGGYHDGMNLYQYVRGNPVNHWDPNGTDCCGLEIGGHLIALYYLLGEKFRTSPRRQQERVCRQLVTLPSAPQAWDIEELVWGMTKFNGHGCGTGKCGAQKDNDPKNATVQVLGNCYRPDEVNYWLWGYANRLCSDAGHGWNVVVQNYPQDLFNLSLQRRTRHVHSLEHALWLVNMHRTFRGGAAGRRAWTVAGYAGRFNAPDAQINNQCSPCDKSYDGTLWAYIGDASDLLNLDPADQPIHVTVRARDIQ